MAGVFSHTPTTTNDATKFAGQPLIFTCDDSSSTPDRYVIQVYERVTAGSSTGQVDLGQFYLTPNADGVAHFDLSNVIDGRLNAPSTLFWAKVSSRGTNWAVNVPNPGSPAESSKR